MRALIIRGWERENKRKGKIEIAIILKNLPYLDTFATLPHFVLAVMFVSIILAYSQIGIL